MQQKHKREKEKNKSENVVVQTYSQMTVLSPL